MYPFLISATSIYRDPLSDIPILFAGQNNIIKITIENISTFVEIIPSIDIVNTFDSDMQFCDASQFPLTCTPGLPVTVDLRVNPTSYQDFTGCCTPLYTLIFGGDSGQEDYPSNYFVNHYLLPSQLNHNTLVVVNRDFGTVIIGSVNVITIDINHQFNFEPYPDESASLLFSSNSDLVWDPLIPNKITWTPTVIGDVNQFGVNYMSNKWKQPTCFQPNQYFEVPITLTGIATNVNGLVCDKLSISTPENSPNVTAGLCLLETTLANFSIGEQKIYNWKLKYEFAFTNGMFVYFNPGLFKNNGFQFENEYFGGVINDAPLAGYRIKYTTSLIDGTEYEMYPYGAFSYELQQKNFSVTFTADSSNQTFVIKLKFYMIADFDNVYKALPFSNNKKWRTSNVLGLINDNSMPSVYNGTKNIYALCVLKDVIDDLPHIAFVQQKTSVQARFFNRSVNNNPSEFLNPVFSFLRNGNSVTNFSTTTKTKITFKINIPSLYGALTFCVFQLIDETKFNENTDFLSNYNSSRSDIVTNSTTSNLNNLLFSPSTKINEGGGNYTISAHVGTDVELGSTYRLMVIVYTLNTPNTFLSNTIAVTALNEVDYATCSPQFESTFYGFNNTRTNFNCWFPVGRERVKHETVIKSTNTSMTDCLLNYGINGVWRDYLKKITLRVYFKSIGYPNIDKTTFFMISEHVSVRPEPFNKWTLDNGLSVKFEEPVKIKTTFTKRIPWLPTAFDPNKVLVCNNATFMQRYSAGSASQPSIDDNGVNNSWVGKEVFYEYDYELYLTPNEGDPILRHFISTYKVNPITDEPLNSGNTSVLTGYQLSGLNVVSGVYENINESFCTSYYSELQLKFTKSNLFEGKFMFLIEKENLQEMDLVNNFDYLPTVLEIPVNFMDDYFSDTELNKAIVKIDPNVFGIGTYKVISIISLEG